MKILATIKPFEDETTGELYWNAGSIRCRYDDEDEDTEVSCAEVDAIRTIKAAWSASCWGLKIV